MTIWKYELRGALTELEMPFGARVIHAGYQDNALPTLWAEVDPSLPSVTRRFWVTGTGHDVPSGVHVGSAVCGAFVWHVYEEEQ